MASGKSIITAAHCVRNVRHKEIKATVGELHLDQQERGTELVVLNVVVHPGHKSYHPTQNDSNLPIVILSIL